MFSESEVKFKGFRLFDGVDKMFVQHFGHLF